MIDLNISQFLITIVPNAKAAIVPYFRSVTAAIRDILSGKGVSSDRGLKSVARSRADRQFSGKRI